MATGTRYHLITLRRVWDLGASEADPRKRAPDALFERHARVFLKPPGKADIDAARGAERRLIDDVFEAIDELGFAVVKTDEWDTMRSAPGWTPAGIRRHTQGGERLLDLAAYGLSTDVLELNGAAWRPAPMLGPTVEDAMQTLRQMAVEQDLEPAPLGPETILRKDPANRRRRPRTISVDR